MGGWIASDDTSTKPEWTAQFHLSCTASESHKGPEQCSSILWKFVLFHHPAPVSQHLTTLWGKWDHLSTFNPTNVLQLSAILSERAPSYFSHCLLGTSQETRNLSLGIPCLPAQHFTHESSSRENTVTVKTDLMKAVNCRGKQIEFCQSLFKQETYLCSQGAMYVRCLQEGQDFPYFFQLQITSPLLVQTLINTEHQMDRRNTFPSISQKRFLNFFWSGHSFCLMLQDAKPVTCLNHKNPFLLPWQ